MEEKPSKVSLKSSDRRGSDKEIVHSDTRDLWITTTLSQAQLNMPLSEVCEGFDEEGRIINKTPRPGRGSLDEGYKASHKPEELDEHALVELELHRDSSMEINLGEKDTASQIEAEKSSSMSSLNIAKHMPHRAYWAEQQSRPSSALLLGYQLGIGRDHFLTKELQRYIQGLKKRRSKRLYVN
uniref:Catsper channel auxiliary subunit zeta n=1 Tax=Nomascus leucogenys TaxID=61853 RepID=G1QYJ2_NOMLE